MIKGKTWKLKWRYIKLIIAHVRPLQQLWRVSVFCVVSVWYVETANRFSNSTMYIHIHTYTNCKWLLHVKTMLNFPAEKQIHPIQCIYLYSKPTHIMPIAADHDYHHELRNMDHLQYSALDLFPSFDNDFPFQNRRTPIISLPPHWSHQAVPHPLSYEII